MNITPLHAKQKRILVGAGVLLIVAFGYLLFKPKPIYPVPDLVSFSGGHFLIKSNMQDLESFEYQRNRGLTDFHVNFAINAEGKLACKSPVSGNAATAVPVPAKCSEEAFAKWAADHPELHFIVSFEGTEVVSGFEKLKSVVPDFQKRVVVQIEDLKQYDTLKSMGYSQFAWFVRDATMEPKDVMMQIDTHFVQSIVLPVFLAEEELVDSLRSQKIKTYAYTVDNCQVLAKMKEVGVNAVYTSDLEPYHCYAKPALTKDDAPPVGIQVVNR